MNIPGNNKNDSSYSNNVEFDIRKLIDFRSLFLSLLYWMPLLVLIAAFSMLIIFFGLKFIYRDSMTRWNAQTRIINNPRNDRASLFYKQLDTRTISEIVASRGTVERVISLHELSPEDVASLPSLISVSLDRSKPNLILVNVSHNNRQRAMDLASYVANAGIAEYVDFQEGTLKMLLGERKRLKETLEKELGKLENDLKEINKESKSFNPLRELDSLESKRNELTYSIENSKIKLLGLKAQEAEMVDILKKVPKEIEGWRKVYGDDTKETEKLLLELTLLKQRYTDNNPIVIAAQAAYNHKLAAPRKTGSDEVTFQANIVYFQMQEKYYSITVAIKMEEHSITNMTALLEDLTKKAATLTPFAEKYKSISEKISALQRQITTFQATIDDYEFQRASTAANKDLTQLPMTASAVTKNEMNYYLISAFFALFLTAGIALLIAVKEIFAGTVKSVREAVGITSWVRAGEIPDPTAKDITNEFVNSCMISSFNIVAFNLGVGKIMLMTEFENGLNSKVMPTWLEQFGVNGRRVFRIFLCNQTPPDDFTPPANPVSDPVADDLISITKFADKGVFKHSDRLFLLPAECELLKADIQTLLSNYDLIIIEYTLSKGQIPHQLLGQLGGIVDFALFLAAFKKTTKPQLKALAGFYNEHSSSTHPAIIVSDMRTPFIRK